MIYTLSLLFCFALPFLPLWDRLMESLGMESRTYPGSTDHGKFWSIVVILGVFVSNAMGQLLPLGHTMALLAAAFGRSVFSRLIESKTLTVDRKEVDTKTHTITEKIERVVDADGITVQPTKD